MNLILDAAWAPLERLVEVSRTDKLVPDHVHITCNDACKVMRIGRSVSSLAW